MPDQSDAITRLRKVNYALEDLPETISLPQRPGDEPREPLPVVEATVDEIAFAIVEAERESTAAYRRADALKRLCQSFWTRFARERFAMVDLTEEERAAITATMKRVALLMDEIGWTTPLADLTEAQVRALIEEAVEGFREAMSDIARAQTPEVPF